MPADEIKTNNLRRGSPEKDLAIGNNRNPLNGDPGRNVVVPQFRTGIQNGVHSNGDSARFSVHSKNNNFVISESSDRWMAGDSGICRKHPLGATATFVAVERVQLVIIT